MIFDQAKATLDFGEPVAVLLIGVLHFLPDSDDPTDPYRIVTCLMDAVPSGSHSGLAAGGPHGPSVGRGGP